jgi:hypothetical protein
MRILGFDSRGRDSASYIDEMLVDCVYPLTNKRRNQSRVLCENIERLSPCFCIKFLHLLEKLKQRRYSCDV